MKYYVGNSLRGWFVFEADNDEDAIVKGPPIFHYHYPSEKGRWVQVFKIVDIFQGNTNPADEGDVVKHKEAWFG